jgi:SAM-dependent methyltransferase
MRNPNLWKPTKYAVRNGKLYASPKGTGAGSRLIAQLVASAYQEQIPKYVKGKLADIGCGYVPLYEFYRPYIDDVTAVDWAESLHQNQNLDIVHDLNNTPIPELKDGEFDSVICSDVLEHIYEPDNLIRELARILLGGGYLLLNVPFYYWVHEAPHDHYRYTEYCLKRKLEEAGFRIVELQPLGGALATWVDLTSKMLSGLGIIGKVPAVCLQNAALLAKRTTMGNRLISYRAGNLPLGYFVVAKKI